MLTVKYHSLTDDAEYVYSEVDYVTKSGGILYAVKADGTNVQFGPNYRDDPGSPPTVAYVMNEQGATVARYEFRPQPFPEGVGIISNSPNVAKPETAAAA